MSQDMEALDKLRRLLSEADNLANSGDLPGAQAKCQEASSHMMRLTHLCQGRPQLRAESEPLFSRLKATVNRLKKMQKNGQSGGSGRTDLYKEEPAAGLAEDNPFSEQAVLQSYRLQERQQLELMTRRETELDRLAQDMIDLEDIFRKLNELVNEQGEQLQLIEDHVIQVEDQVVEGEKQLAAAIVSKRSSGKKKIIIMCVVVAAALILALILYLVLSKVV